MATLSWKSSTLLAATLLVAFGLQAGAVKILLNLNRSPEAAATAEAHTASLKPTPRLPTATEVERQTVIDPPPPNEAAMLASPPKPAIAASDPPLPTHPTAHPEANPEARLTTTTAATPPAAHSAPTAPVNDPPPPAPNPPTATASVEAAPRPTAGHSAPPAVAPPPVAVATPSAEVATIKPTVPAPAEGLRDAAWLKTRDPKNYTVQLYSGKDLDKLKEIAASTASTDPQAYFTTGSRTSPWYSLVIGDYPDSASARAVAAAIAARSTQLKPWVRRLDEIQANMR
ncbi:MAG: SPOR domain-containing protein [Candidatus Competibacteraceae bacterium]|nr:SPOR domain-containing protein [Candidatus Competibacteraceae bacterium]